MVLTLLASSSTLLTAHPTIGCSTGYMDELREDWDALVEAAAQTSGFAIELSALSEDELEGLVAYLQDAPPLPFRFVSVHGPSKDRRMSDDELVSLLERLPARVSAIVMHPDAMVFGQREEAINHLEPLRPVGIVDSRDLHQLLIFMAIAQRRQHRDEVLTIDVERGLEPGTRPRVGKAAERRRSVGITGRARGH